MKVTMIMIFLLSLFTVNFAVIIVSKTRHVTTEIIIWLLCHHYCLFSVLLVLLLLI